MKNSEESRISRRQGLVAVSPVIVFLSLYVVVSLVAGDFYKMPIAVALVAASAWAVADRKSTRLNSSHM